MSEKDKREADKSEASLHDAVAQALAPQNTEGQSLPASGQASCQASGTAVSGPVTDPTTTPAAPAPSDDEMQALDTCGKYGGVTSEGEPCEGLSSFGVPGSQYGITPGRCFRHRPEALEASAKRKAEFLEAYLNQPVSLIKVCRDMKMSVSQPYLWKMTDRSFARTFEALLIIVDAVRHHLGEDVMFKRIMDKDADAAALRIFWHVNRSKGRWQDHRKSAKAPVAGPTIINAGGDVTVNKIHWQVGDDFVPF